MPNFLTTDSVWTYELILTSNLEMNMLIIVDADKEWLFIKLNLNDLYYQALNFIGYCM